jgi:hypothetical protein
MFVLFFFLLLFAATGVAVLVGASADSRQPGDWYPGH